jgi:hypothetical protein
VNWFAARRLQIPLRATPYIPRCPGNFQQKFRADVSYEELFGERYRTESAMKDAFTGRDKAIQPVLPSVREGIHPGFKPPFLSKKRQWV